MRLNILFLLINNMRALKLIRFQHIEYHQLDFKNLNFMRSLALPEPKNSWYSLPTFLYISHYIVSLGKTSKYTNIIAYVPQS